MGDWEIAHSGAWREAPGSEALTTAPLENRMSMADRDGKIWMDGKLIDWRDAKIHVLTHTLHYGMGVFEGVRAYQAVDGSTASCDEPA